MKAVTLLAFIALCAVTACHNGGDSGADTTPVAGAPAPSASAAIAPAPATPAPAPAADTSKAGKKKSK